MKLLYLRLGMTEWIQLQQNLYPLFPQAIFPRVLLNSSCPKKIAHIYNVQLNLMYHSSKSCFPTSVTLKFLVLTHSIPRMIIS